MICQNCKTIVESEINFCPNCGISIHKKGQIEKNEHVNKVILFYIVMLVFLVITFILYKEGISLIKEIVIEGVFAVIILAFTFFDFKNIVKLYNLPKINLLFFTGVVLTPFITGFLVYYGIEFVNIYLFDESQNYFSEYIDYPNSMFWAVLFVAILPPVFEELGFRGFLFNQLIKITSPKVTIALTAFIFALVHLSIISLLWIFPFGLLLGYLRYKYNTLWLGMIIHFIHNLIVLSLDYYYFDTTLL